MREPGLDRHEWETEWQALEEQLEDSPAETLPAVGDLIERMLVDQGVPIHDEVADDGVDPELVSDYREARRISDLVEQGENVDPGDIGAAVRLYRELYAHVISKTID
jgi:hypothetical protein